MSEEELRADAGAMGVTTSFETDGETDTFDPEYRLEAGRRCFDAGRRAACGLRRKQPRSPEHSARQRHGEGARQRYSARSTRSGSPAARCPSTRMATSSPRRSCPSGMHTVEVAVLDEAGQRRAVSARPASSSTRTGSTSAWRTSRCRKAALPAPRSCCRATTRRYDFDSTFDGRLAFYVNGSSAITGADGERRHARRTGERSVQQLPGQVAGLAVPPHRSRLPLPDLRR